MTREEKIICKIYLEDLDKTHSCNEYKLLMALIEQEPKIGHWTDDGCCSCCNKQTLPLDISGYASGYDSFCPNCGAKMESEG